MRAGFTLILIVCLGLSGSAQIQQASVEGVVVDTSGLVVPGASFELHDPATNQHRSAVTDTSGGFRLTNVPPSVYRPARRAVRVCAVRATRPELERGADGARAGDPGAGLDHRDRVAT